MPIESIFSSKPLDLSGWREVRMDNPYFEEGVLIPRTEKRVYEREMDGETVSVGVFFHDGSLAFVAWGYEKDALCSYHAIAESDGRLSEAVNSCPDFTIVRKAGGVAGFSLKAFGRMYTWEGEPVTSGWRHVVSSKIQTFSPLITAFLLIFCFVALRQQALAASSFHLAMTDFMAGFFLLFGGLKLINLQGFVAMYRTYDVLAKRFVGYAYAYPFLEIGLGLLFLSGSYLTVANIFTVVLVVIGSVGITRALLQKEEIRCACLGAVFSIPLTTVTLVENVLMGLMAVFMLLIPVLSH